MQVFFPIVFHRCIIDINCVCVCVGGGIACEGFGCGWAESLYIEVQVAQVWTCPGVLYSENRMNTPCIFLTGMGAFIGTHILRSSSKCVVRHNASWVMVTWDPLCGQTDRQDWKHDFRYYRRAVCGYFVLGHYPNLFACGSLPRLLIIILQVPQLMRRLSILIGH